ncbi:MAG: UDP-glucose 4-epimerase GalE [Planctomycetia bacterium]|jgi:UDP-glucose 4-epimerase|nr:UDP-glucose 4-epimerase GalE [Planctomycetia bacterium]NCF99648.1 UDP-glucose 4-epimerase GalE [Planctomycetia bacterium]NCG13445.1 UDP-glucose 4-epimerase GalE [Planctomycetia bacterium]NCG55970.1 UDP-glucose 4-epimerase GalE [Pseudomonadota bacterium]
MKILVVGGAGYIGSHCVLESLRAGHEILVLDDLRTGHRESIPDVELVQGSLHEARVLKSVFESNRIDAVFNLAASCSVPESVKDPGLYYHNNLAGTLNLVSAMIDAGVNKLVHSSTAAVYGDPVDIPIPEDHAMEPVNPYGDSKKLIEETLREISKAHDMKFVCLRYFNAAGADASGLIGEDHKEESHLIPLLLQCALGHRSHFTIFGNDWDTRDGSCIRDFVHVTDIARAHLLALDRIDDIGGQSINLGSAQGASVREVVEVAKKVTGCDFEVREEGRRDGDPSVLLAANEKAKNLLGWTPENSDLDFIIETAWRWHRTHPGGYGSEFQKMPGQTSRFGELAIRLGFVTESDVERVLLEQEKVRSEGRGHKMMGLCMVELGLISTTQLVEILRNYDEDSD